MSGTTYEMHLDWVEAQIVEARATVEEAMKLALSSARLAAAMSRRAAAIRAAADASESEANYSDAVDRQACAQLGAARNRVKALEDEASRTRAAIAGIEQ